MSLVRRAFRGQAEERYQPVPTGLLGSGWVPPTQSGQHVDVVTALRNDAVWACRRVLVSSILAMPPRTMQRRSGQTVPRQTDARLVRRPSLVMGRRAWIGSMASSLVLDANMYGLVSAFDDSARPLSVEPVPASLVRWQNIDGILTPSVNQRAHKLWPVGELVHQPASVFLRAGQRVADSPVEFGRETIGMSLAAEEFGAQFFRDGGQPTGLITAKAKLTPEEASAIKTAWRKARYGNREPAVFGDDLKYESTSVDPKDSQFIDTLRFTIEKVCRFWGVPPSFAYAAVSGQAITYTNIAQSDVQFLKHSLQTWVDDIEEMWTSLLASGAEVQLDPKGLLRLDPKTRHDDQHASPTSAHRPARTDGTSRSATHSSSTDEPRPRTTQR